MKTELTPETIKNDPLALGRMYHRGLHAGLWRSVSGALRIFQESGISIHKTSFQHAVRVAALPESITNLFLEIPLSNAGAQSVLSAVRREGIAALGARCTMLRAVGFLSEKELLSAISDERAFVSAANPRAQPNMRRSKNLLRPLDLAHQYAQGLRAGRWTTKKDAAVILGYAATDVVRSIKISKLPSEVLSLFGNNLTFDIGQELLGFAKALGAGELVTQATSVAEDGKRSPAEQVLRALRARHPDRSATALNPLAIAETYFAGRQEGRWRSRTAADTILRLPTDTVAVAVRISRLPSAVLELFCAEQFRAFDGRKLLLLQKQLGSAALLQNAKKIALMNPKPSKKNLFAILAGSQPSPSRGLRDVCAEFRWVAKGGVSHIRITSPHIEVLNQHLGDIEDLCEFLLAKK